MIINLPFSYVWSEKTEKFYIIDRERVGGCVYMKRFFTTVYTEPDNVIEKVRLKLKEKIANQTPCLMTNTTRTEANWREYSKQVEFGGTYYIIDMGIEKVKYRDLIEENFAPKKRKGFWYCACILDDVTTILGTYTTYEEASKVAGKYSIATGKETTIHAIKEGSDIILTQITPKTRQDKGKYKIEIHKYLIFGGYTDDFIQ